MEKFWKSHAFTGKHWDESGRHFWLWNAPDLSISGIPFSAPAVHGLSRPLVVSATNGGVKLPVDLNASRLHFLGNVTFPDGYPIIGRFGDPVGRYVIVYSDGSRQEVPLRWGLEVARSNMISVASRVDPATAVGERVLIYQKDPTREVYQARLLSVRTQPQKIVQIECELKPATAAGHAPPPDTHHGKTGPMGAEEQVLALFAVTAEVVVRGEPR